MRRRDRTRARASANNLPTVALAIRSSTPTPPFDHSDTLPPPAARYSAQPASANPIIAVPSLQPHSLRRASICARQTSRVMGSRAATARSLRCHSSRRVPTLELPCRKTVGGRVRDVVAPGRLGFVQGESWLSRGGHQRTHPAYNGRPLPQWPQQDPEVPHDVQKG